MSYHYPKPNEFLNTVMQLWQNAQDAIAKKDWSLMKTLVERMVVHCTHFSVFSWMHNSDDIRSGTSEILVLAGKECNKCMAAHLAKDCFFYALEIQANVGRCERSSKTMSEALECLIQTHLHNDDLESAKTLLDEWNRKQLTPNHPDVKLALGRGNMEFGLALVKNCRYKVAIDYLTPAVEVLEEYDPQFRNSESEAIFASALGYCIYMATGTMSALSTLRQARILWKSLNWPIDHIKTIVYSLKNYMECLLWVDEPSEQSAVHSELLMLHSVLVELHSDMLIADVFTCLGMVAFNNEREQKAVVFFEQACALHKQTKGSEQNSEEIMKLLRFIGVANYNCLDFTKAAAAYLECLHLLETQHSMEVNKTSHVAECCASLGFTFSRLRDFDNMLMYYERAFQMEMLLSSEDLELIITNIGSLYHVKAVKLGNEGQEDLSFKYHSQAHSAFHKALRYSWKSFPFINYGYYLFCQGNYFEASSILHQGYHNGIIDKDTVEFDHTEDPILIDDLRHELQGLDFIRIPSTIISLYLKCLAQVKMGDVSGAESTVGHLEHEVLTCQFTDYYCEGYGQDRMEALCKSLVGYAFRAVGKHIKATVAFESALCSLPQYEACRLNLQAQKMVHGTFTAKENNTHLCAM
ncbi:hypothetical protein CAPTEDRAFT_224250 [Capitella teleta]|uniref:Uncharacterized protein n=1 Tax=Capitella teleta TaxID=283909 RepID=R7UU32_CAPTE|nr:hypothetical protein CAPTEDRAFT_224250 [Capitella teleta]|eukprot:ELU09653.1 hypothetical protein CAPTEDRAFT_224250 [Capitella teleta]